MFKIVKIVGLLALALILSACGGSSGSNTGVGSTQQGLVVSASKTEAYEGEDITFSIEAYDLDGTELSANISCDQGTLSNNTLTLPSTDTKLAIKCEASTALSSGAILSQELTLSVLPIELFFNDDISDVSELKIVGATYRGPQISIDDITISLGNTPLKALLLDSQIVFEIPLGSASSSTLAIDTPYENLLLDITISNAVIPSNPADYVADFYSQLESRLQSSSYDQSLTENLLLSLDQARLELSALSAQELAYLSAVISLNLEPLLTIGTTGSTTANFLSPSGNCIVGYTELGIGVVAIVKGLYVTSTGAGAALGLVTAAVGAVLVYDGFNRVNEYCEQTIECRIDQIANEFKALSVSSPSVANEEVVFSEATPKALQVLAKKDLPPEIKSDYNEKFWMFSAALVELKKLIDIDLDLAEIALSNEEPKFKPDNAADYTLSVSVPNVRADISAGSGLDVTLFKIDKNLNTPAHLENTPFDIEIQHNEYPDVRYTQAAEFKPDRSPFTIRYSITDSETPPIRNGELRYNYMSGSRALVQCGTVPQDTYQETVVLDLSNCSGALCQATFSDVSGAYFSGKIFDVYRSKIEFPVVKDELQRFTEDEVDYTLFIDSDETASFTLDRNTLEFSGTSRELISYSWTLDGDVMVCDYIYQATGFPNSCSSPGPSNCGTIGN